MMMLLLVDSYVTPKLATYWWHPVGYNYGFTRALPKQKK